MRTACMNQHHSVGLTALKILLGQHKNKRNTFQTSRESTALEMIGARVDLQGTWLCFLSQENKSLYQHTSLCVKCLKPLRKGKSYFSQVNMNCISLIFLPFFPLKIFTKGNFF